MRTATVQAGTCPTTCPTVRSSPVAMARRGVVCGIITTTLLGLGSVAEAHGRYPATDSVAFHRADTDTLVVGTTFGTLISSDGGQGWWWVCDGAVGYDDDAEDPIYAVTGPGTLLAATTRGLAISRDGGCSWTGAGGELADTWISDLSVAADGSVWLTTTSFGGPSDLYVSHDDAASFQPAGLASSEILWQTLRLAGDERIYVSGLALPQDGGTARTVLHASEDGGATWTERSIPEGASPSTYLLFADGDRLFSRVVTGDGQFLHRSVDGARTWSMVLAVSGDDRPELTAVAALPQPGRYVAGTRFAGAYRSDDGGATWQLTPTPSRLACAAAMGDDDVVYGCADNWNDEMALGRSVDGHSWDPVLTWDRIRGPLECPAATAQRDVCEPRWFIVAEFLGLESDDPADPDPTGDGPGRDPDAADSGSCAAAPGLVWLLVALPWRRRRATDFALRSL